MFNEHRKGIWTEKKMRGDQKYAVLLQNHLHVQRWEAKNLHDKGKASGLRLLKKVMASFTISPLFGWNDTLN